MASDSLSQAARARDIILDGDGATMRNREIASRLGVPGSQVGAILKRAASRGWIERRGRGMWGAPTRSSVTIYGLVLRADLTRGDGIVMVPALGAQVRVTGTQSQIRILAGQMADADAEVRVDGMAVVGADGSFDTIAAVNVESFERAERAFSALDGWTTPRTADEIMADLRGT